jgi:hypothetical protein
VKNQALQAWNFAPKIESPPAAKVAKSHWLLAIFSPGDFGKVALEIGPKPIPRSVRSLRTQQRAQCRCQEPLGFIWLAK